jgi:tRNA (cmo5U34)-methyltransferase
MSDLVDQTVVTGDKWTFDSGVTKVFENMLERSIPQYEAMRALTTSLAIAHAKDNTWIVDLGCSRGDALKPILSQRGARNRYLGVEISEHMIEAARESLAGFVQTGIVEIKPLDLRYQYPPLKASVTLGILTLQFVPIEHRQNVIQSVYDSLLPGGAFLFVEKILGAGATLDRLMVTQYLDLKRSNGYTEEQIQTKRKSLEGVLVPLTATANEQLLRAAGFTDIDCFWRYLNFAGWIAIKR